jgi:hypothetical protein
MINKILTLACVFLIVLSGCNKDGSSLSSSSEYMSVSAPTNSGGNQTQPGVITAGEWNDLDNWSFWESLISKDDYKSMPSYWSFFNMNRISVEVTGTDSKPVINALVKLKRGSSTIYSAQTDNSGKAVLWADLFQNTSNADLSKLVVDINNGSSIISKVKSYKEGINKVVISPGSVEDKIELSFVVDATGSMGDELEFLKTELLDVISRVKIANPTSLILTSSVFYRDKGDEYVTRISGFTNNHSVTTDFIKNQRAMGGGDFPEAVHTALDKGVNELKWSSGGKTKLLFLVLDAPPHHTAEDIQDIQNSVLKASEKGIKIIPITASGIDKETEFLMRFIAMSTNGTYVFITNHSGIGNNHLEASVGQYQVEFLNDLMVRLINKYAK